MIKFGDKYKCYGCRNCEKICPVGAIELKEDEEGFLYPFFNSDLCINCDKCEVVCPVISILKRQEVSDKYFGVISKDDKVLEKSASGGAFFEIARYMISEYRGTVYGAFIDDKFNVNHIAVSSIADLDKIQGSKYVQSDVKNNFTFIKEKLDKRQFVLFSGTPCQVAGLYAFLGRDYENLITIDLICHGVPSNKIFKSYLDYKEKKTGRKILNYYFREKTIYGAPNEMIVYENKKSVKRNALRSHFAKAYNSATIMRKSCYQCKFASEERVGDFTIGDFWGAEDYWKGIDILIGVSVIKINTEKAEKLFANIYKQFKGIEVNSKVVIREQGSLKNPLKEPDGRERSVLDLWDKGWDFCSKKYYNPKHYYIARCKLLIPTVWKQKLKRIMNKA